MFKVNDKDTRTTSSYFIPPENTRKPVQEDTDVFKTSSGLLKKVTTSYDQTRRHHDVWKKTSDLRRPEDVWFTSFWDIQFTTSWRRLIYDVSGRLVYNVLKTSNLQCLEEVWFRTSWRRLINNVLKTSVKRRLCSNVEATSVQRQKILFFLILYCLKYSENFKFSSLG